MTSVKKTSSETGHSENRDTRVFDRLYDQYAPRVLGYLLRLTGNRAEAEDLTQETFLAAYHSQQGFLGRSHPLTWLIGIARRRWRDGARHRTVPTEPLQDTQSGTDDPADRLALSATLDAALGRLSQSEREVLLLVAVQGLSCREAAEILGEPVGTIKWRLYESIRQLRQILNAAEDRYEARYGSKATDKQAECTGRHFPRMAARSCRPSDSG